MKNYQKGISMVEMLIVISVIGILVAVVSPQFSKLRDNQNLKNAGTTVLSALNKARSQTLASYNSSTYGVHFQSDKVVIFKGTAFSSGDSNNENINITAPATISAITLTGGAVDLYFNRLTGVPNIIGTVTVAISGISKIITISVVGGISLN